MRAPSLGKDPLSIGKIPPSADVVNLYFNDSTGEGDEGEKDVTSPWSKNGVQIVEAPAFQELALSASAARSNGGSSAARKTMKKS